MEAKFKPGDKIIFKNEKLSGVVIDILKGGKIKLILDDGFDMDVYEDELIKINATGKALNQFYKKEEASVPAETPVAQQFGKTGEINFITLPAEENHVLSGPVLFILENSTAYHLLYTINYKTQFDFSGIASGVLKPGEQYESDKYHRGDIKLWTGFQIELLFFKNGNYKYVKPFIKELGKQLPELQQADKNFKGRNAFARIQLICDMNEQPVNFDQLKDAFKTKQVSRQPESSPDIFSYSSAIEADLHIEELADNYFNLSNAEILEIQLSHFRKILNHAIVKQLRSVTFIHGIGDGVLKHCIHKELNDYKGVRYRQAAMSKYGLGATEVLL